MKVYGFYNSMFFNCFTTVVYLIQQLVQWAILITDPGVAAKFRVEFNETLNEEKAKYCPS